MNEIERRLAQLSPSQRAALERKLSSRKLPSAAREIPARTKEDGSPLSFAEHRLWLVDQIEPDHPFYNMPLAADLRGPLSISSLKQALDVVARRHETLRTTYEMQGDEPVRCVQQDPVAWPVTIQDASQWPEDDLRRQLREASRRSFDIRVGPLMRCHIYRRSDEHHVVLLVMHHIISDGWSTAVLLQEWSASYDAIQRGETPKLPPLGTSYGDFAVWQRKRLVGERMEQELAYWERELDGSPAVTDLPLDHPRPTIQDFEGRRCALEIDAELGSRLRRFAQDMQVTEFIVMLAAYAALLRVHTGQEDICIGTVVANRREPALESLIGFFVNTLVVRCRVNAQMTFGDLVRQVGQTFTGGMSHQDLPFERLVETLAPGRDRSHSPLFQTALVLQDMPELQHAGDLDVRPLDVDHGTAKHDLTLLLFPEAGGYRGHVEYRKRLFESATIERLARSWITLLDSACRDSEQAILDLPSQAPEDASLSAKWSVGAPLSDAAPVTNLPAEVERHASPDRPAIIYQEKTTSYAAFKQASMFVAERLKSLGVAPGDRVVACLPRSPELLTLMFATWRAGAVYVPMDPELPIDRRRWMQHDCEPTLIVQDDIHIHGDSFTSDDDRESPETDLPTISFGELMDGEGSDSFETDPEQAAVGAGDLAYIIYTSGSSGHPKGVEVEHGSIVRFLRGQAAVMLVNAESRVLHSLSPSFDGGLSEPLLALCRGGCSVVATAEESRDPAKLTALINGSGVGVAKFPPPKLALLEPSETPGLRTVSTGGDTLTGELARRWLESGRRMLNGYGPTEASVGCAMCELTLPVDAKPPIGIPLPGQIVYIVDPADRLAPVGVPGEICIGGPGVARGYRNLPEATENSFVNAPWADGQRVYRTGDRGRWRWDGQLEFLGRLDEQVKIRGYRIEPAEVAAALNACDNVDQAIVVAVTNESGEQRLIGYAAPDAKQFALADEMDGQVDAWQSLFEQTHRAAPVAIDPEFNISGWIDSFTGGAIAADEMREWADNAARRILASQPQRVLEVGCGTGLILHRVAPHVAEYVGVDFLESSLNEVQKVLDGRGDREHVQLRLRRADELEGLPKRGFDTVVLNSVVQYFPSVEYLQRVMRAVEPLVADGGSIFIGDVRNYRLQPALAAAIEIARADDEMTVDALRAAVYARISHEEELLLAPEWFDWLPATMGRVRDVQCHLKEDSGDNELARFRYDVIVRFKSDLTADSPHDTAPDPDIVDAATAGSSWLDPSAEFEKWQNAGRPFTRVQGITNRRVSAQQWLWKRLQDRERTSGKMSVGELKTAVLEHCTGVDPSEVFGQARKHGVLGDSRWDFRVMWGAEPDQFEVFMGPSAPDMPLERSSTVAKRTPSGPIPNDQASLSNHPLRDKVAARLTPDWMKQLRDALPEYMVPSSIVVLSELPRTLQGKIDRRALPPPPAGRPAWAPAIVLPENDEEQLIVDVWEALLGVTPIGVTDNFFDIGGHSLLAVRVVSEIARRSGHNLPLAALFHDPTPQRLAAMLRDPEAASFVSSLVPLRSREARQRNESNDSSGNKDANSAAPLFCIHPAGGTVFCYLDLAKHLPGSREVFGIQAVGVEGQRPPHDSMEEMAEHYARVVRQQLSQGEATSRCHLCGWSLGGNVAYEVARRLKGSGVDVGVVGLLDAGAMPGEQALREDDFLHLVMALFPGENHLPLEQLRSLPPAEQMQYFADRARRAGLIPPDDPHGGRHIYEVFQKNIKVIHQHTTLPYDGLVHLYRPAEQQATGELFDDPLLGWGPLANVVLSRVSGDHAHMVQEPHVIELAKKLEVALKAADEKAAEV